MTSLLTSRIRKAIEAKVHDLEPGKILVRFIDWHPRAWYRPKWCEHWVMGSVVLRAGQLEFVEPRPLTERWAFLPPANPDGIEVLQLPGVE